MKSYRETESDVRMRVRHENKLLGVLIRQVRGERGEISTMRFLGNGKYMINGHVGSFDDCMNKIRQGK